MTRRTYFIAQETDDGTVETLDVPYTNLRSTKALLRRMAEHPAMDVTRLFIEDVFGGTVFKITIKRGGTGR